jgi:ATP phosphoribosyltransferase
VKVGALDRHTRDWILETSAERARALLRNDLSVVGKVSYVESREELVALARELGGRDSMGVYRPGGTASNVVYNMGYLQGGIAAPFELCWYGTGARHNPTEPLEPVDALRCVGITPYCTSHKEDDALALCVVDDRQRAILAVLVSRGAELTADESWPTPDVVIVGLDGYLNAHYSVGRWLNRCGAIALLIDRAEATTDTAWEPLADRIRWVLGRAQELREWGILDRVPHPLLRHAEIVGTASDGPVAVWEPNLKAALSLSVGQPRRPRGDDLGAGDAYAGAYLHARLTGRSVQDAHELAAEFAGKVLDEVGARLTPPTDLTALFGRLIERRSDDTSEGRLFRRVRESHGLTVISGGQTGVDQLGLVGASALGLAAFAIVPRGGRTELPDRPLRKDTALFDGATFELQSNSFRFRTWANVYLGDGTLIWDFHKGPGSEATREACRALGRPWLDVGGVETDEILERTTRWATRHRIRVLNVAGNRASLLTDLEADTVRDQIAVVLRCLARTWARGNSTFVSPSKTASAGAKRSATDRRLRLGIAGAASTRSLANQFLREQLGMPNVGPRVLAGSTRGSWLEWAYFRPRELPVLLAESAVDVILCGRDVIEEAEIDHSVLVDTGLFNQLLVLVGRAPDAADRASVRTVVSQYPNLAQRLVASLNLNANIRAIQGAAESWLGWGLADAAVDTWRTGRTAGANGLRLLAPLGSTSLVLASSPMPATGQPKTMRRLVREFDRWLGC